MKNIKFKKHFPLFFFFIFTNINLSLAQIENVNITDNENKPLIGISALSINKSDLNLPQDNNEAMSGENSSIICLGSGWKKINFRVEVLIEDLKVGFPNLFMDLGESNDQKNCFSLEKVPFSAQRHIDRILREIDQTHQEMVAMTKDADFNPISMSISKNDSTNGYDQFIIDEQKEDPNKEEVTTPFQLRNEKASLIKKISRAELLIGGTEAFGMGVLLLLPKSFTKWEEGIINLAGKNIKRGFTTPPVWDHDNWAINYIGHPYAGGLYYNAIRSQGAGRLESFLYSVFQSTFWEYVIEAVAEQPSKTDLIVTPVIGSILGELSHFATIKMRRNGFTPMEKVLVIIINPMYALNNGFKH